MIVLLDHWVVLAVCSVRSHAAHVYSCHWHIFVSTCGVQYGCTCMCDVSV